MIPTRQEIEEVTIITCGPNNDHNCDGEGPTLYGGNHVPTTDDISKAGKGYTWGSVSCSKCGMTALDRSYWEDQP